MARVELWESEPRGHVIHLTSEPTRPVLYLPCPLAGGVLQGMPSIVARWIRQHPVHDGYLGLPNNWVDYKHTFAVHRGLSKVGTVKRIASRAVLGFVYETC